MATGYCSQENIILYWCNKGAGLVAYIRTSTQQEERNVSTGSCQNAQHSIKLIKQICPFSLLHLHSLSKDSRQNHFRCEFSVPPT